MKRLLVVVMLLGMVTLGAGQALAAAACVCVGKSYSQGACGSRDSAPGDYLKILCNIPDVLIFSQYIKNTDAMINYSNKGKAYDASTGWHCSSSSQQ